MESAWTYLTGGGGLGGYTVVFHKGSGASVELWHDSASGFTFQRSLDAQVLLLTSTELFAQLSVNYSASSQSGVVLGSPYFRRDLTMKTNRISRV